MAKSNGQSESIYNLTKHLVKDNIYPIYFFFGEDSYTIEKAVKKVAAFVEPFIESDFDKETIELAKDSNVSQIVDLASSFPFGGNKRMLIVKSFESISDKKSFADYVNDPSDFSILIITQSGKKLDPSREPYSSLVEKGWLFEAHELKGANLQSWIVNRAKELKLSITPDNAYLMIDLIGENKALIEMNLQKIYDYLGDGKEITVDVIKEHTSVTKEYNIFNLLDAVGKGNKKESLAVAYNLIDSGFEMTQIIAMLTRFVTTIAQSIELGAKKLSIFQAAKEAGVSEYYYKNCANARFLKSHSRLRNASKALLDADITLKSTATDPKSIVSVLLSKMLN